MIRCMDPFAEFVILALAATRLTLLVTRDTITEPIRHIIFMHFPPPDNQRHGWEYQRWYRAGKERRKDLKKLGGLSWLERRFVEWDHEEPIRDPSFLGSLLSCPDCVGVWVGLAAAVSYWVEPTAALYAATPLAIATVVSFVTRRGGFA